MREAHLRGSCACAPGRAAHSRSSLAGIRQPDSVRSPAPRKQPHSQRARALQACVPSPGSRWMAGSGCGLQAPPGGSRRGDPRRLRLRAARDHSAGAPRGSAALSPPPPRPGAGAGAAPPLDGARCSIRTAGLRWAPERETGQAPAQLPSNGTPANFQGRGGGVWRTRDAPARRRRAGLLNLARRPATGLALQGEAAISRNKPH